MLMINRQIAPNGRRAEGLRSTPEVFIGMLACKNFGKQIVKLVYGFGRLGA
jgi:NADPH-dependent curcumin reductase CurA